MWKLDQQEYKRIVQKKNQRPVQEATTVVLVSLIRLLAVEMERSGYIQETFRVKLDQQENVGGGDEEGDSQVTPPPPVSDVKNRVDNGTVKIFGRGVHLDILYLKCLRHSGRTFQQNVTM